jgi:two-component system, LuxR family, response regulator FixJ
VRGLLPRGSIGVERAMVPVQLFSENRAAIGTIRALLRASCETTVHANAARVPPEALDAGGCVLVDMDEPVGWWRATLAEAIARPTLPIVLVTARPVARDVVLAVRLGAADVVDWAADGDGLRAAVEHCRPPAQRVSPSQRERCRLELLTPRQRHVLALASTGLASKAIARLLGVSTRTVEAHRARMVKRLMARSFLELVRQQIRHEA